MCIANTTTTTINDFVDHQARRVPDYSESTVPDPVSLDNIVVAGRR